MDPPLRHWLVVYSLWFVPEVSEAGEIDTGIRGILLNRRNIPIMSMPIESMLLAVNSNFLVFSVSSDDMMGQSFASLVSTVAAAESAIGLAIFVITFRVRGTIAVESINSIQGSGPFSLGEHIRF
ncbi:UNVERIFIED_CONTAM: NADH-ubiquinone oxidoreductase chain 4L [Sesamum calycinum]|uniref:NADH-ubiquinone oxidoreductase chain 4L n=1 Tax=Sesamum calycinum TaxID=2727403 RepID=A0AAW2J0G2_9LAMI